jgi:hypothetical protein
MEETMNEYLTQIKKTSQDTTRSSQDSLWGANIYLMSYLKSMCKLYPGMMGEEFRDVGDIDGKMYGINILTSEDKALRIYCWDSWTSKAVHRFNSIAQYRVGNNVEVIPWADVSEVRGRIGKALQCYSEINTVYDKDERPVYLVMSFGINEGHEGAHQLAAYTIDSVLRPLAIFNFYGDMKSTLVVSSDKAVKGEWTDDDTNIKISPDGKAVYVPVVKRGNPDKKQPKEQRNYHVYQFNGTEFVYKENLNN